MRAVLGIDAAWTETQPSGVALVAESRSGWRLLAAEPSYRTFTDRAVGRPKSEARPTGVRPDVSELLTAAAAMSGCPVGLVALDIPLARSPIVGRRVCDDEISRAYGGRKCGTHSPTALRPAAISDRLRDDFARQGYPLLTRAPASMGIIEVYPHPALIELSGAAERLPYKVSKRGSYWPGASAAEKRRLLFAQWGEIVSLLDREVDGCAAELLSPNQDAPRVELKAYEDRLDAIVCAWVVTGEQQLLATKTRQSGFPSRGPLPAPDRL